MAFLLQMQALETGAWAYGKHEIESCVESACIMHRGQVIGNSRQRLHISSTGWPLTFFTEGNIQMLSSHQKRALGLRSAVHGQEYAKSFEEASFLVRVYN
ncbi:hypothetical protein LZ31DRAFT_550205 [Colletotrichum somersetense]|nr:hypothetical protein LZ31DRAFT_550205 [Colletotrichum somersetense]